MELNATSSSISGANPNHSESRCPMTSSSSASWNNSSVSASRYPLIFAASDADSTRIGHHPAPAYSSCKARPSLSGKSPERPGDKAPGGGAEGAVDVRLRRALPSPASKTAPPGPSGILFPVRHEEGLSPLRFLFLKVADHLVEIRIPL